MPEQLHAEYAVHSGLGVFVPNDTLRDRINELERENRDLQNKLLIQQDEPEAAKLANVYSSYPFNQRSEITIDMGRNDGVSVGAAVTYGETVFIGSIIEAREAVSTVRTIFDPSFEIPVRVGDAEINGLFHGGNTVYVDLLPRDAEIKVGDTVITACSSIPYGMEIGRVSEIVEVVGEPFKKAFIEPPIRLGELRDVQVYR